MYGIIRRFNPVEGQAHRVLTQIKDGFAKEVASLPGFVSYHIIDAGDGSLVSSSVFETKETADEGARHAAAWVKDNISRMLRLAPVIVSGELKVQIAKGGVAAPPTSPTPPARQARALH